MNFILRFLSVSVIVLSVPSLVLAHGGAGLTFSTISTTEGGNPYIVDIDYVDLVIEAGRTGRFNFDLFEDEARTKSVDFNNMWVRISEKKEDSKFGKMIFAGSIAKQRFGGDGFSYTFSKGGTYLLSVRYEKDDGELLDTTVAEAEFTLDVAPSRDELSFAYTSKEFLYGIIGTILVLGGSAGAYFAYRKYA